VHLRLQLWHRQLMSRHLLILLVHLRSQQLWHRQLMSRHLLILLGHLRLLCLCLQVHLRLRCFHRLHLPEQVLVQALAQASAQVLD
jgi:hypothetical protein